MTSSTPRGDRHEAVVETSTSSGPGARHQGRPLRSLAAVLTLAITVLVGSSGMQAASAQTAESAFGDLRVSKVTGHSANGARFVGRYHVVRFVARNNHVRAVGRLTGTLTRKSGATSDVSRRVRLPLNMAATRAANPVAPQVRQPAASAGPATSRGVLSCQVLNLVLGPLDLNLLGLVVHLDRVVLTITAVPGAGALLGNLLCAVAGLLDGVGLGGLNGILVNLLNAILGILQA